MTGATQPGLGAVKFMMLDIEEMKRRAETELRRQLVSVGQGRGLTGGPFEAMQRATAQSVLRALVNVGVVSEEDATKWNARFDDEADQQPETTQYATNANVVPQVQAIRRSRRRRGRPATEPSIAEHLRPPPAVFAVSSPADADLSLRSIEIYPGAVAVLSTQLAALEDGVTTWLDASLQDDLGTEYRHALAQVHHGRWEHVFTPAVPAEASVLQVVIGRERFEVRLP